LEVQLIKIINLYVFDKVNAQDATPEVGAGDTKTPEPAEKKDGENLAVNGPQKPTNDTKKRKGARWKPSEVQRSPNSGPSAAKPSDSFGGE